VENARQLLLSDVGNEHDQVGRYFMCHPLAPRGTVQLNREPATADYLDADELALMKGKSSANDVWVEGRFSPTAKKQRDLGIGSCWFWASGSEYYMEMAPNRDSRVQLMPGENDTDEVLGLKKVHITWTLSDLDKETYKQTTDMFKAA